MRVSQPVECDACGEPRRGSVDGGNAIEGGLDLPFAEFGHYNGFWDMFDSEDEPWKLCHDCVVKFLETFPRLAQRLKRGLHPTLTLPKPCCRYSYTMVWGSDPSGTVVLAGDDGDWDIPDEPRGSE